MNETVLFVDDTSLTLSIIRNLFNDEGLNVLTAENAVEALTLIRNHDVAVVVSDNIMPGITGVEFLSSLRDISPDTVKILMSAYADLPSALAAINRSEVFRYVLKPWKDEDMKDAVRESLRRYRIRQSLRKEDEDILRSLAQTIELKDPSTKGHCDRVAVYALLLAKALGLPKHMQREIRYGSWLHDCGKIGISEGILNGNRSLNDEEFETIKQHSVWGAEVAEKARLSETARNIIQYHHERYDGKGYPSGIAGEKIPLEARVVAIADVYDALATDRPYRAGYSRNKTLEMMQGMRGTALDPKILDLFLDLIRKSDANLLSETPGKIEMQTAPGE
jgi:putative two-component system response regulator